jgi:hypothetical protein
MMEAASSSDGGSVIDSSPEAGRVEAGSVEAGSVEAGSVEAGPTACMTTGATPDRRFVEWPLPPDSPPLGEYSVGKDTVLDNTTGLMWERVPPETLQPLADVTTRCTSLAAGGYNDWRVPTRIELLSILDYGQSGTLLNANIFGSIESPGYDTEMWSVSTYPLTSLDGQQFLVDTAYSFTMVDMPTGPYLSRCVRSGCISTAPTRFSVSGDTALDLITRVVWQRGTAPAAMTSDAAQTYCAMLQLDSMTGWRLPTIRELASIYDETQLTAPLWDTTTFSPANGTEFWSSTPDSKGPVGWQRYTMDFGSSSSIRTEDTPAAGTSVDELVRCVR